MHVGGHGRFVAGLVAEVLFRSRPAGDARTVGAVNSEHEI
jgi:hypothetical protein